MITRQLWIRNLIGAASDIADEKRQEERWLAADAYAWERPEELFCVLFDDYNFELFLEENFSSFSSNQSLAAFEFRDALIAFGNQTPTHLKPAEVLADPRWEDVRQKAKVFVEAFDGKWPVDPAVKDGSLPS